MPSPHEEGRRPDQAAPAEPPAGSPAAPPAAVALEDEPVSLADLRRHDAVVFLLFWTLAGVVFLQFFTRYVLNDSLGWTEEIARYLLIAVTFVGAIIGVRKREHVAVELLYRWISPRAGNAVRLAIDGASAVFFFFLAVICAQLALKTRQEMVSIDVPKAVVYWLVCASFAVMGLFALSWFWRRLTGRVGAAEPPPAAID